MQIKHTPLTNARYWSAIAIASVFGTNLGDLYANDSGLGLLGGLPILAVIWAIVYFVEKRVQKPTEVFYWLCIIILRTGATNIADYVCGRRHMGVDRWAFSAGLAVGMAALAFWSSRAERAATGANTRKLLPDTDALYWVCMLLAGVFGTALGDAIQKALGQGEASLILAGVLAVTLLLYNKGLLGWVYGYWITVGVARTAGTAVGDWLAETKKLNIGLTVATVISGVVFVAILTLWKHKRADEAPAG